MAVSFLGKSFQYAVVAGFLAVSCLAYLREPPAPQTIICAVHMMKLGFMQTTYDYASFDMTTKRCIGQLATREDDYPVLNLN